MATDVLGRRLAQYGGSFSVDDALLTFPNLPGAAAFVPYIVTQLGIQYQQAISRFYGLNRNAVFLVAGRSQGQSSLQQILAPKGSISSFFSTYGNVCRASENLMQFSLSTGCSGGPTGQTSSKTILKASTCVVNQLAFSSDAESATINNNFAMSFESLELVENS